MISYQKCKVAKQIQSVVKLENLIFKTTLRNIYEIDQQIEVVIAQDTENQLVGFITFKNHLDYYEIYNLGVDEHFRNQKIASTMLEMLNDLPNILEVRKSNSIAINFYENKNFKQIATRKNYYGNEDALVFQKLQLKQKAYAKINLVLNVNEKLANGYHKINFLMNSVNLADDVLIQQATEDQMIVVNDQQLSNENNLAFKALQIMKNKFSIKNNYKIIIDKKIPVAAGMAGGSSDAAAVFRIVNELEQLNLSLEQLATIGSELGSDIPYCIYSQLAVVNGQGEQVEILKESVPASFVVAINPGVGLSTKKVFENHQIEANTARDINSVLNAKSYQQFYDLVHNDLAPTAIRLCPDIKKIQDEIFAKYKLKSLVSGSGPTVLVFVQHQALALEIYEYMEMKYEHVYLTKTR